MINLIATATIGGGLTATATLPVITVTSTTDEMVLDETPNEVPDGIIAAFTVDDDFSDIVIYYATDPDATLMRLTDSYYSVTDTNEFTLTFAPITGSILRCDYIKA